MKILKSCAICIVGVLLALTLLGSGKQPLADASSQPVDDADAIKVTSIDTLTGTVAHLYAEDPTLFTTSQPPYLSAPMKLYELSDDEYVEVDFITDDFDALPERWLYVLQPDHEYVAVVDLSASPLPESASGGCFLFSNNLSAGDVGSICLISTGLRTTESTNAQTIIYSQVKFVTDDDINLRHGRTDQLVGRAGYYNGQAYLQLSCRGGTLKQDSVEQTTYYTTDGADEAVKLEVYGSKNGVCTPYELDSDTYLWPSQHQQRELQDIFRQINATLNDLYRTTAATSVTYAVSQTNP